MKPELPPREAVEELVVVMGLIMTAVLITVGVTIACSWALGFYD